MISSDGRELFAAMPRNEMMRRTDDWASGLCLMYSRSWLHATVVLYRALDKEACRQWQCVIHGGAK